MRELLQEQFKIKVDTEENAIRIIEEYKNNASTGGYSVKKSSYTTKTKKVKKEVVEEFFIVDICLTYED